MVNIKRLASVAAVLGMAAVGVTAMPHAANAWWRHGVWIAGPVVVVGPPVVYAAPRVVYVPPAVWVRPGWYGGVWVRGHWRR